MKPITAKDLLILDPRLHVEVLQCYPMPEQVIWQAGKGDYSEVPMHDIFPPSSDECGKWIVEELLGNDKGHWGPLEHPHITLSVSGFVHNVIVQARTHRIGTSWDVQSQRYTGKNVQKVAKGELEVADVFYIRPPGYYTNRKGAKYDWTQENYDSEIRDTKKACIKYNDYRTLIGVSEEHARDYLPQAIRQNFVVTFNLRSVLHFMDLRAKLDAQVEIQALTEAMSVKLATWAPNVWKYYEAKRLHRARLAP
jgi:thymidylate synthase (FAD)